MQEKPDLSIVQKTYDLILWYLPILNKLPRDHKFNLGDRIINRLYNLLESLVTAQYSKDKLILLQNINLELTLLRYQNRLLLDLKLFSQEKYELVSQKVNAIGIELNSWLKNLNK